MNKSFHYWIVIFLALPCVYGFSQPAIWSPRGPGAGGALYNPSFNPENPQEYFVSCDMSELFHSTDFGLSYSQVDFTQVLTGGRVCYGNNGTLFTYSNDDDFGNMQILKSINGGVTWTPLNNPITSEWIYFLFVDYNNPDRIIIGYYGDVYFSSNGGTTYNKIHSNTDGAGAFIGGVFFDGNNIYVGMNDGLLVSTNAGTNFSMASVTGIPTNQKLISFAGAKVGGTTRFFCVTGNVNDVYVGITGGDVYDYMSNQGVYMMDYGSGSWQKKVTGISSGYGISYVGMATNDINTVYIGGIDANSSYPLVMKSTNAGTNWSSVFKTNNNQNIATGWSGFGGDRGWSYGEYLLGMSVCPSNPDYILFTDLGFVHKSADGGVSWEQAYVDPSTENPAGSATPQRHYYKSVGIENTSCWQVHWSDANNIFAGYSDIKGSRSTDGGDSWSFDFSGHNGNSMYRIAQHPSNGTLFAATSNVHDMYMSTYLADGQLDSNDGEGKILYSTDKGKTWQLIKNFNHPVFWITLDPNNPNTAYASVIHSTQGGVYKCTNLQNLGSSTWTKLPAPPRTQGHPASIVVLNDGKVVCTYSGRRASSFTASSGCFLYDPTSNSWTDVSDAGMQYWTKDVIIDPNDATQNTWYVCVFSGWGGAPNNKGGIYRTKNRGQSWTKLSGTTLQRVTSLTFNPNNADQVFITTEYEGLWMSNNINGTNPTFSRVANYPFKHPERVFFNPYNTNEMWVTSFGNGMKMGLLNVSSPVATITATDATAGEPNATGQFTVTLSPAPSANVTVNLTRTGTATNGTDYNTIAGTLTVGTSGTATITVTPIDDSAVEGNETVILTLSSGSGYIVGSPNNATVTISDDDVATTPTATIAATDATAGEPNATGQFTITLSPAPSVNVTVNLTRTGTATNGTDYNTIAGTLTVGTSGTATITVTPIDDSAVEGNETVILTLASGSGYTVGSPSSATVTISDNDVATTPTATIAATDATAGEPNATGQFTITLSPAPSANVTVNLTRAGTATNGTDYNTIAGTLTVGTSGTATITVTPIDDSAVEGNETVILTLASGSGYTVGSPSSATVTISDNDVATTPTATIAATDATAGEPNATGQFTITLSPAPSANVTVNLTRTGTATNGTDYNTIGGTLTVGTSGTATITVTPIDDSAVEGNETVILTLASGSGYTVGSPSSATVTISDNDASNSVPAITTTTLPQGTVGVAYSKTLSATGGDGTLVWTVSAGNLPAGLMLSSNGVISGTPTTAATSNFTVKVADSDGNTGAADEDTQALTVVINSDAIVLTGIAFTSTSMTLPVGKTSELVVVPLPDGAVLPSLNFSVSDNSVAMVDPSGVVTTLAVGTVTITVQTSDGSFSDSLILTVNEEKVDDIPKYFSPNNDSVHDFWEWRNLNKYRDCVVSVFTRSGQEVFRAHGYQNNWDGTYRGSTLPQGDYYYVLKFDDGRSGKGALRIIR